MSRGEILQVLVLGIFCITWCLTAACGSGQEQPWEASSSVMAFVQALGKRILSLAGVKAHVLV